MLSAGTILGGRYRLDERIAGGGMGDVWRGTDEVLGRTVAIKILLPALLEEPGFAERFRGEARTMATINHPGVVDVYDYGNENATAFLIMEYIEGDALSRTLSRVGRLTPARTMALVAQAADALHAAHEKGIVHRDVKPGNLLVRPNGTLVLTDFGIARSAAVGQLTAAGSVLGTASYISPEQASGSQATPLSDVYALGVVAYQCLSGRRPFEGDNPLEIAMRHVRDTAPPLPSDIPLAVRQIVERAMAKDPAARWPTAAALAQIARRTSAQLAASGAATGVAVGRPVPPGMAPTSGGAAGAARPTSGSPIPASPAPGGPPGSPAVPMSPVPTSPVVPGGTRVIPGGYVPTAPVSPHASPVSGAPGSPGPVGPVSGGGFARGAASVPAPPRQVVDTGYTYVGTGPYPVGGAGQRQEGTRRTGLIIVAVILAVLVLLMCVVGGFLLLRNAGNNSTGGGGTSTPSSTPSRDYKDIPCDDLKKRSFSDVEISLKRNKFTVKRVDQPGGRAGQVVDIQPCTHVAVGSEVTVTVATGRSGGGGSSNGPGGSSPGTGGPGGPGGPPPATCLPLVGCPPTTGQP
jgi:serine/threonine-protein kinase